MSKSALQGNFVPQFDPKEILIVNMECRSTICEIAAVATQAAAMDYQIKAMQLTGKEWAATEMLEHTATSVTTAPDGASDPGHPISPGLQDLDE